MRSCSPPRPVLSVPDPAPTRMFGLGWSFYALDWAIRLVMVPVVAHRRKRPLEALAWLAVIFFVPVVGTLLYLWLGEYGVRRSEERQEDVRRRIDRTGAARLLAPWQSPEPAGTAPSGLVRVSERLMRPRMEGLRTLGGNAVELMEEGEVIDRLVEEIGRARDHVHLLFFIFRPDGTGWRVARALAEACGRGVSCRVLADSWASRAMFGEMEPWLAERGVEVRGLLELHPLRHPLARLDVRNHRKVAVMDGRVAFTGSANVHDADMGLDEGVWHQIAARVEGPAVLPLQMVFLEDWMMADGGMPDDPDRLLREPEAAGEVPVQVVPSGPGYPADALQHLFTEALHEARERAVLTTPYFVPDEATRLALRLAALRGARTELVLPRESDRRMADAAGRAYFDELLEVGVRIHRHPSGILHSKSLGVDGRTAVLGTANFDRRSMFLNYEVTLLVHDADVVADLVRRQERYIRRAETLEHESWCASRSTAREVADDVAKLLSPLL